MINENKMEKYTKFPNLILEALMKAKLNGNEWRILMVILRKTKGFHRDWDHISYSQFAKYTGLHRSHASRTVKALEARNIIRVDRGRRINSYSINEKTMTWIPEGVTNLGNKLLPRNVTKVLPDKVNTKEKKYILKKEDYYKSIGDTN